MRAGLGKPAPQSGFVGTESAILLTGVLFASVIDAEAGPRPGRYKGKLTRECSAAKVLERSVATGANASNPTDPNASFSTRVRCSGTFGTGDLLNIHLDVLPDGKVSADISGKISRKDKSPLEFRAQGEGED
jgi:hypothetical protein